MCSTKIKSVSTTQSMRHLRKPKERVESQGDWTKKNKATKGQILEILKLELAKGETDD